MLTEEQIKALEELYQKVKPKKKGLK